MVHLHLPLDLACKVAWTPRTQWGGGRAFRWALLSVTEVDLGGGVALLIVVVVVVSMPWRGASDYMHRAPHRILSGCLSLHFSLVAVADGGRMTGGVYPPLSC